jgi:starch phosphorylase
MFAGPAGLHGYSPSGGLELIASGRFSHGDTEVFHPLVDSLTYHDPLLALADYEAYVDCQDRVAAAWQDTEAWTRMSILNTARGGKFSSDAQSRSIAMTSGT